MKRRKMKEYGIYPILAKEILKMAEADQDMREKNLLDGSWDDSVDRKNAARLRDIVAHIGWPTISKVGVRASHAAWLIVQHADHAPGFQEACLDLMKSYIGEANQIDWCDAAYLEDRVRVNTGRLQLYGTQFEEVGGELVPKPIYDPENVDARRREVGLDTLAENIARMREKYRQSPK